MFRIIGRSLFLVPPLFLIATTSFAQGKSSDPNSAFGQPVGTVEGSVPPAFGIKGFYVGIGMGGAFNPGATDWNQHNFTALNNLAGAISRNKNSSAFTTGIIGGWQVPISELNSNWTWPIVIGPEIDFNYVGDLRKHDTGTYVQPPGRIAPAGTYAFTTDRGSNFFGTIRGHWGYVFLDHRAQAYISGGFAYAGNSGGGGSVVYTSPTGGSTVFTRNGSNSSHTGSAVGLGGEYSWFNMVARVEFMYVDLKSNSHTFTGPAGTQYYISNDSKFHFSVVRAAFLYHF